MNESSLLYWLWLISLKGFGSATVNHLLDIFGTPEAVFKATSEDYDKKTALKPAQKTTLVQNKDTTLAERSIRYMEKHDITLITKEDDLFPEPLKQIYNPPAALFAKGDTSLLERYVKIGIVGSRKASPGGLAQAAALSRELSSAGVTVVSGFAKGIDSAAHEAALSEIGNTIGVLGCGINVCYPKENAELYKQFIKNGGLLLTEFALDEQPVSFHFPLRNRIISGLSDGILVVEAAQKSGALITAKHAAEQGKNVYAIPKDITLIQGVGCNELIKDGAKVVTCAKDILEDYVQYHI